MDMRLEVVKGVLLPFLGTSLGAASVFFMRDCINSSLEKILNGFAAGVMLAASVWSLLLPAIEQGACFGRFSFLPAVAGFLLGMLFLIGMDCVTNRLRQRENAAGLSKTGLLWLVITIHNIPEGMAVGVIYAGCILDGAHRKVMEAFTLALGIAIQNFPEGAIVSLPMCAMGEEKKRAFLYGMLSGLVEPLAALFTILSVSFAVPAMPYLLGFAAGAMVYVVMMELAPEMTGTDNSKAGIFLFACGFSLMLAFDVALG